MSAYSVVINVTGPNGSVAANLQYDVRIPDCREIIESAITDMLDAAGMPQDYDGDDGEDFKGDDEPPTQPEPGPYFEVDSRLAELRLGLLAAPQDKKPVWERMIDNALDERLKIMAANEKKGKAK